MVSPTAILFDVDGTLVDSNYLHVDAWQRALASIGVRSPAWRIHRSVGLDSDGLLDRLAEGADHRDRDRASEVHRRLYGAAADRLAPFDGAIQLLDELRAHGRTVALATSASEDELTLLRRVLRLPDDSADLVSTKADDVETAKPDPGIVSLALDRAGVDARDAIFVGDAEWDMLAAGRAGVRAIGVLSGGIGADVLRDAGAIEVVEDVSALRVSSLLA